MSLLNDASLVFIPSGYKEDKVYSIIPSNGAGDLDFVRGCDATRINPQSLVETTPWNLVNYSEDFTNAAFYKYQAIASSNSVLAPNGTTTADTLSDNAASDVHIAFQILNLKKGLNTISIYAKANTLSNFILRFNDLTNIFSSNTFDLSNGTTTGTNQSIENVGNGWYRCSFTADLLLDASTYCYVMLNNGSSEVYVGTGKSIYVWGFQVNVGSLKPYFPTTDRLNVPRLTYENGCPSLLLEKQSTNLATYSEDFNNAGWTGFNSTVTANTTISPDGTQNADTVVYGSSGYLYQQISIVSWSSVTISIFSKTNSQCINFGGATPSGTDTFTTIAYANGWYRQILTRVFTSPATGIVQFLPFGNNTTLYLWGAQIEQSSYPTSYIKTTSTSVTRLADSCYKTGISSLIGQTEGTLFAEITTQASPANNWFQITDGTANNWIFIGLNTNKLVCYIRAGAVTYIFNQSFTFTDGVSCRMALGYKSGDCAFYINGSEIATTQATFSISAPFNRVVFGDLLNPPNDSAKYGQALLFKRRLTNTELAQLTTI